MSIEYKWSDKQKNAYLEDKPDIITAYKVVEMEEIKGTDKYGMFPLYVEIDGTQYEEYNELNTIEDDSDKVLNTKDKETKEQITYKAYYHLFAEKRDAEDWASLYKIRTVSTIECVVKKEDIKDMGELMWSDVIVAKAFLIPSIGE